MEEKEKRELMARIEEVEKEMEKKVRRPQRRRRRRRQAPGCSSGRGGGNQHPRLLRPRQPRRIQLAQMRS